MTKENWIAIGVAAMTAIMTTIGWVITWKNTSRTLKDKEQNAQPAQNAGNPVLNINQTSARLAPLSVRYKRTVRILSQIVNFIATYFLVQQALKTSPITRGEVVIIAACLWFTAVTFIMPLIVGVYEYFEIILGISTSPKRT